MAEPFLFFLAFIGGFGLGVFYFGGLWWTVRRIPAVRHPALLSLGSLFGRLGVTVLGFYLMTGGHWGRLLISLLAFLVARKIMIRRWGPQQKDLHSEAKRGIHNAYNA